MSLAAVLRQAHPSRVIALAGTRTGVLGLTTVGSLLVRMGSSVILTRLLTPDAFGMVGIINSVFFALAMITDLGVQTYIVRHERGDERHFQNTLWTIHASRCIALAIVGMAIAPIVSTVMHKPELTLPFAVSALSFVFSGLTSLSVLTALRYDSSRKLALYDLSLQIAQTLLCILLALWLRNVWAIIISIVFVAAAKAVTSYRIFPGGLHRLTRDRDIARDFFIFSRFILASSILSLLLLQADKLVLARLFTLQEFGLYAIALNLAAAPSSFADAYISRISFPVYAQAWRDNPASMRNIYYSVGRLPSLLYSFGCGALAGGASLIIAILYDPRYQGAAPLLTLLAIGTALRFPNFSAAELQTAVGRLKGPMYANIARIVWLGVAGTAGFILFGAVGVVGSVGLMELPAMFYNWWAIRRIGVFDLGKEMQTLLVAALGGGLSFAIAQVGLMLLPSL